MEDGLESQVSEKISLVDFDRVLDFLRRLLDKWENKPSTHIRVSNAGVSVPKNSSVARELVNDLGGFSELSYAIAFLPESFYVKADFRQGMLLVRCKDSTILHSVLRLWKEASKAVNISRDLLNSAIPIEGQRFAFACLNESGGLSETPENSVNLEKYYYLQYMNEIGMSHIQSRFSSFLKDTQSSDGGWNFSPDGRSSILSTANAVLILTSAGELDPINSAIDFLMREKEKTGFWIQDRCPELVVTSVVCFSLMKTQKYGEESRQVLRSIRNTLLEKSQGVEYDSIIVDVLHQAGVDFDDHMKMALQDRLEKSMPETITGDVLPPEKLASALLILHACGEHMADPRVEKAINQLIDTRNRDGGWPSLENPETSSLHSTIMTLVALNRMGYLKTA